jgi:pimeloyl-ACP methyl ester carboxylesterase
MPFFDGSRGRIHHTAWLPDGDVRAVVVFCHGGFGEHVGLYETLGRRLAADGIALHALDAIGHGRSDGERDLMPSWDVYVDDARTLAGLAQAQHPGRPLVLMGHSAGGVAALLLAQRSPDLAQALVVSAPPAQPLPWVEELAEGGADEVDAPDPAEAFSTHPEYLDALRTDPPVHRGPVPPQTIEALMRTWPEIAARAAEGPVADGGRSPPGSTGRRPDRPGVHGPAQRREGAPGRQPQGGRVEVGHLRVGLGPRRAQHARVLRRRPLRGPTCPACCPQ